MTDIIDEVLEAESILNHDAHPDFADPAWEAWRIRSDRAAAWALRKMREAKAELERLEQCYTDELDRLNAWREDVMRGPHTTMARFESKLIDYRRQLEENNPELPKTYKVPGGAIKRRKSPDVIDIVDADAFVAWAMTRGRIDLLRIQPAKAELAKAGESRHAIDETGEVDPEGVLLVADEPAHGVVHLHRGESYSVTVD